MDEKTVAALLKIKREMGAGFLKNPQRVGAFLSDFLPGQPGERQYGKRQVLVRLLEAGVPQQLTTQTAPSDAEFAALARRWSAALFMDEHITHQALRIWHFAANAAPRAAIDIHAILGAAGQAMQIVQQQPKPAQQPQQPQPLGFIRRTPQQASLNNVLWLACEAGDTKKVTDLLKSGADANAKKPVNKGNEDRDTLLISAVKKGRTEIVKLLLAAGADIDATNKHGMTALLLATEKKFTEIAKVLLSAGAYVNARTETGWTALILASNNGDTEIVKLLLAAGADANAKNIWGMTALQIAEEKKNFKIVLMLRAAGQPQPAQSSRSSKTASRLRSQKAAPGALVRELISSVRSGDLLEVQRLLASGAKANAKDNQGCSALMWAAMNGHTKIVKALLAAGANPCVADKKGWNALKFADMNGHTEIVKLLRDAGAYE